MWSSCMVAAMEVPSTLAEVALAEDTTCFVAAAAEVPSALAAVVLAEDPTCFVAVSMGSGTIMRRSWTVVAGLAAVALAEDATCFVAMSTVELNSRFCTGSAGRGIAELCSSVHGKDNSA